MRGGAPVRRSLATERSSDFSSLSLLLRCNFTSDDSVIKVCRRGKSVSPLNNTALGRKIRRSLNMNAPPCRVLISTSGSALCLLLWSDSGLHKQAVASQHFFRPRWRIFHLFPFPFLSLSLRDPLSSATRLQRWTDMTQQTGRKTWEASSCALLIDSLDVISFRLKRFFVVFLTLKNPASFRRGAHLPWLKFFFSLCYSTGASLHCYLWYILNFN